MVPSGFWTPSATSQIRINGAQSLQPYGLRPAPSLSTLNPRRYRREPKTRYGMCWVDTFPVALAATSSGALRGAPKTYGKGTAVREREANRTLPRRGLFGKDAKQRFCLFKELCILALPLSHLFRESCRACPSPRGAGLPVRSRFCGKFVVQEAHIVGPQGIPGEKNHLGGAGRDTDSSGCHRRLARRVRAY